MAQTLTRARVVDILHDRVGLTKKEAGDLLAKVSGITKVTLVARGDTKVLQVDLSGNEHIDPSEIPARLVTAGFRLVEFRKGEVDLETAFMRLTQGLVS